MDVRTATLRLKTARCVAATEIAFAGKPVDERPVPGAGLRPDLNGLLLTMPAKQLVYLIDHGYRRWIADLSTLIRLFGPNAQVVETEATIEIPLGTPTYDQARLVRHGRGIYLVDYEPRGTALRNRPVAAGALRCFFAEQVQSLNRERFSVLESGAEFEGPQYG